MSSFFDKLNLRPQERRLVVVVGLAFFVVFNIWFVWPYFGDWSRVHRQLGEARDQLDKYQTEIARVPEYEARLAQLESKGSEVMSSAQVRDLRRTIEQQAQRSGVTWNEIRPGRTSSTVATNQFFEEVTYILQVNTEESSLVNFLYELGAGDSMIRVKQMDIGPDTSQTKLKGNIVLAASFQIGNDPSRLQASAQ